MDHRTFLNQLPAEVRKSLQLKNNRKASTQCLLHFGLIITLGALITASVPGWQWLLIPQGILLVFLFNLQHECTHKTPFKNSALNEIIGFICGAIIIQPFLAFRYFHLDHHRHTNIPDKDPELIGHPKPQTRKALLLYLITHQYWYAKVQLLIKHALFTIDSTYVPSNKLSVLKLEAKLLCLLYSVVGIISFFIGPLLLWAWLMPLFLGFPLLKLYHLAEHGQCPLVDDYFQNTRTVLTNRWVRLITWNMPFHAEHHLLPGVPYHQLPKLHEMVKDHLKHKSTSYRQFSHFYLSTLRQQ